MGKDIGIQAAVLIDGRDATGFLNQANISLPMEPADATVFRSPGFARRFLASLIGGAISFGGFSDWDIDLLNNQIASILGAPRSTHDVMMGPIGLDVGAPSIFAKSIRNNWSTRQMPDGMIAFSADMGITADSPATCVGRCLISPHGTDAVTSTESQTLQFNGAVGAQEYALRAVGGTEVFLFHAGNTNAQMKAGIEALPEFADVTVTVTGAPTTSTDPDSGATLYTGTKTIAFDAGVAVPQLEVLNSEAHELTLTNVTGPGTWNGATVTPGDDEADVEAALQATGGDYVDVTVKGSSPAITTTDWTDGIVATGTADNPAAATDDDDGTVCTLGNGETVDIDLGAARSIANIMLRIGSPSASAGDILLIIGSNNADYSSPTTLLSKTNSQLAGLSDNTFASLSATAFRYIRVSWGGISLPLLELELLSAASTSTGVYRAYFPYAVGNIAVAAVTGAGYARTTLTQGESLSTLVVGGTTTQGGTTDAIYNLIDAAFNGNPVNDIDPDTTTEAGLEAMLTILSAQGAGKTVTVRIQHSPDDGDGNPTTWSVPTGGEFTGKTEAGAYRLSIDAGITLHPHLRAVIAPGSITGEFVLALTAARN